MICRHCATPLEHTFLDLGFAPPSNAYLSLEDLSKPEKYYPLKVKVCSHCWLVQTEDYAEADAAAVMKQKDIRIVIKVGEGPGFARFWTSDLTHDYISINADYRT